MHCRVVLGAAVLAAIAGQALAQNAGPGSSQTAYVVPVDPTVTTVGLLTVGDEVDSEVGLTYRLVGIPDGSGAFSNGDGSFTWVINHELNADEGAVRAHGATGAFISKWTIDSETLKIATGADLIKKTFAWDPEVGAYVEGPIAFSRFCSGDLPLPGAFYNADTGLGTQTRIYTNGEESGTEGRAFAHILSGPEAGSTYELPGSGNLSFENNVAAPFSGDATVVIGQDDSTGGEVYIYVGQKSDTGNDLEKAGLVGGTLYGLKVQGLPDEDPATGLGGPDSLPFELYELGDVSSWDGAALQAASDAGDVTGFLRPEDGSWDPTNPNNYYWVTTGANGGPGRLWLLQFDDVTQPELGGTISMALDGTEGMQSPDNIVVDRNANVLIQEDPGGSALLARIWYYDAATDTVSVLAEHDADRFLKGAPNFLTTNEESSGIVDATDVLGEGWYLFGVQAHYDVADPELIEGGQILAMYVPAAVACIPDYDKNGELNIEDFVAFQQGWQASQVEADVNTDHEFNILDFVTFQLLFVDGCN